jgi:hypothetical protein
MSSISTPKTTIEFNEAEVKTILINHISANFPINNEKGISLSDVEFSILPGHDDGRHFSAATFQSAKVKIVLTQKK